MQSAAEVAASWVAGLSAKQGKMESGIRSVTVDPGETAAQQADVWANNVLASKEKFRRNVRTGLGNWQDAAIRGLPNVAAGAQRKQAKFEARIGPVLQHVEAGRARLRATPRGGIEQNRARMNAWFDYMRTYQRPA